jgi:hypothetical protein
MNDLEEFERRRSRIEGLAGSPIEQPLTSKSSRILFRNTTGGDRGITKHLLTDGERDSVLDAIISSDHSAYIRHRDALIFDIGLETGLRRGSINSFQTKQFRRSLIERAEGPTVLLEPRRQTSRYEPRTRD